MRSSRRNARETGLPTEQAWRLDVATTVESEPSRARDSWDDELYPSGATVRGARNVHAPVGIFINRALLLLKPGIAKSRGVLRYGILPTESRRGSNNSFVLSDVIAKRRTRAAKTTPRHLRSRVSREHYGH
jgi:hypothetical protein